MRIYTKALKLSAVFAVLAGPVLASTIPLPSGFGDAEFNEICTDGSFDLACEVAVAELRAGNAGSSGDQELNVREPTPSNPFGGFNGQRALTSDESLDLVIDYSASQVLSLTMGGATTSSDLEDLDLSAVKTLMVRLSSRGGGTLAFEDLRFDGEALGPFAETGVSYVAFQADDFTAPFRITGSVVFSFEQGDRLGSNLSSQFKFIDVGLEPIPLPAGLALLVSAFGAVLYLKRCRVRTA